jgi:hypothetical protein
MKQTATQVLHMCALLTLCERDDRRMVINCFYQPLMVSKQTLDARHWLVTPV